MRTKRILGRSILPLCTLSLFPPLTRQQSSSSFPDQPNSFQAPDEATAKSWMKAITDAATAYRAKLEGDAKVIQIDLSKLHCIVRVGVCDPPHPNPRDREQEKPTQPREARVNAVSFLKKHGLQLDSLPERSRTVVYGVKADLTYIEYLKVRACLPARRAGGSDRSMMLMPSVCLFICLSRPLTGVRPRGGRDPR